MKMGIKEFRERIREVSLGDEMIVITNHGKRIGRFIPERTAEAPDIDVKAWAREREEFAKRWRAKTPDWQAKLRNFGIPEDEIGELEAGDKCS
jgi:antitoxin (DNA-binding transcriptional repressor) of toxin-antitoxin stability system